MKYTSDLIPKFGLAVGSAEPSATDGLMDVLSILVPVIEIPGPLSRFSGFDTTVVQRNSFATNQVLSRVASSAAISSVLCTFGRGLWDVYLTASFLANFTQASDGTLAPNGRVNILDAADNIVALLELWAVVALPQQLAFKYRWLFTEDEPSLQMSVGATGVGQTLQLQASVIANRLN